MVNTHRVTTLQDALRYLDENDCYIVNGGTDAMVQHRSWAETPVAFPKDTLFIHDIKELNYIEAMPETFKIGGTCTYESLLFHPGCPKVLKACLELFASPGIRNTATLSGNIANASPAADGLLVLYALNAQIVLQSRNNKLILPVMDMITGLKKTARNKDELITEIVIPTTSFTHSYFKKIGGRKSDAISKVSFTGLARVESGIIKDIRLALGAVNITVVRRPEIEQDLIGKKVTDVISMISDIKARYEPHIKPIDDQRSTSRYRKTVAMNLIETFMKQLAQ